MRKITQDEATELIFEQDSGYVSIHGDVIKRDQPTVVEAFNDVWVLEPGEEVPQNLRDLVQLESRVIDL